ncbi:MAG: MFS transporter [Phycisphaerales bacterium]|nr:MFS transporter [Phycisphaerales bacterium]
MAVTFLTPVLARKRFDANDWQTLLITATPTIFFSLSIFWNDHFNRRPLGRYLLTYWVWACFPLALMALARDYWMLFIPHLITCIGGAGFHPASGELLKGLYPDRIRGRVYSAVWGVSMIVGAAGAYIVGKWMTRDGEAFRTFLPIAAGLQLAGIGVFIWLSRTTGIATRRIIRTRDALDGLSLKERWQRTLEPIGHMGTVLKEDPVFARYEAAYMTYGVGWMIGYALLPILVTTGLGLDYDAISSSTVVAYLLAMVAMLYPAGLLMDKLGAARSTGLSFALLTIYPIGLIMARDAHDLLIASIAYGVAHAGANVGWMLGPVSLAPSPDKVPQYVAIHATLVGIRGKLFQLLGIGLYKLSGSFTLPLLIAAAAYAWSAWQMWRLHGRMKRAKVTGPARKGRVSASHDD